ncbi:hypothetical protein FS837_009759 [Tulasnella sp. UAMH 9824]|nr:hypothetical protein FS837_009759 [Tulasnella sp. UAMH 9824]
MKSMIVSFVAATALFASSVSALDCPPGYGVQDGMCKCWPGYYNDKGPGEDCIPAPPGWRACGGFACFGSTSLIPCGNGLYASDYGNQYCYVCPAGSICPGDVVIEPTPCPPGTNPQVFNSRAASTSVDDCQADPIRAVYIAPKGTCDIPVPEGTHAGDGDCPALQGPRPSDAPGKRRHLQCGAGFKKCPLYTGIGGFDCVDVKNDPEQCGGCVSVDGLPNPTSGPEGQDCTAIPNVSVVNCVEGKCVIENCRKGFTKSKDGKSCTPVSGSSGQEQQDAAKRNAHGRRWHVSHLEN